MWGCGRPQCELVPFQRGSCLDCNIAISLTVDGDAVLLFFMLTDINVGRDRGPAQKQAGSVYINSCAHRTRVLASRDTSTGNTECLYRGGIVHMHGTFRGTSHTLCSLLHTRDVECVYDNNICSHSCLACAIHHDSSIPPHDTDFIGVDNVRIE